MASCLSSLILWCLLLSPCHCSMKTHFVFWNSSNPIFLAENRDHVVLVNSGNLAWEYDQLNLVCPQDQEQHVIYSVSQQEYKACRVTSPRPKIVAICNKPEQLQYVTITFRNFSPTPGGLEFKAGHSYYLISTASGNDLNRRQGGYCATHNMKMVFKVADNSQESNSVNEGVEKEEEQSSPVYSALVPTSTPVYYYRARGQSKEFTYYYSPRDLVKLRKTILARNRQDENETLKAEKLLSSASSMIEISIYLVISLSLGCCHCF